MEFVPNILLKYAEDHSQVEPFVLQELRRETWQKILAPRMISGHLQGRLLAMIAKIMQPKKILEIGTYTGYATLCLAEGLGKHGMIHTIDHNEELVDIQSKYFKKAGKSTQITQYTGNAMHIIPTLGKDFDLVFIDADKINYSNYFDLIIDRVKKGGIILSDNVLWSGKVVEKRAPNDLDTLEITRFNRKISSDKRVETVLLPIRDGISITRKL